MAHCVNDVTLKPGNYTTPRDATLSFAGEAHVRDSHAITSVQPGTPSLSLSSRPVAHVAVPHTTRSTVSGMPSPSASHEDTSP